jgi:hypothetical protein
MRTGKGVGEQVLKVRHGLLGGQRLGSFWILLLSDLSVPTFSLPTEGQSFDSVRWVITFFANRSSHTKDGAKSKGFLLFAAANPPFY